MRRTCLLAVAACAALAVPALADFASGVAAYEKGDFATAAKDWQEEATAGNAEAQFNLGRLYVDGKGVAQNFAEAAVWFRRAADQGYAKAQHNFGAMLGSGQGVRRDYESAYMWMSLCAAQNTPGCAEQRDELATKLSKSKLEHAQHRARDWQPTKAQ